MKKRRPWNPSRSSNSPTPSNAREIDVFSVKTKSSHDLKRRRLQRSSSKSQKKSTDYCESPLKRDAFGSLESLFDLKKPLNLPEIYSLTVEYHQEGYISSFQPGVLKNTKNFVESLPTQQLEPHILERGRLSNISLTCTYEIDDHKNKSEEVKEEPKVESPEVHESTTFVSPVNEEPPTMAENEGEIRKKLKLRL
ncbi:uncharacterized protein LOC143188346 [Calliopsis andreniformis]|uniref:uncharacterized protein LOC143188346 n=1 Tax=Calliopsis andreniformis TaxID=337506 RepID=UPI003FCE0024